ncbi:MAG: glycosyltransferase family 87 protein, partial [Candidatus Baltobacteraceae bacterium]
MSRHGLLAAAGLAIAIAIAGLRPQATPGPFLRDFEAYWAAGSAWNARQDPYGRAVWKNERTVAGVDARRDELLPFVGPPVTLLAWSLIARLPYELAARIWATLLAVCTLALVAGVIAGSGSPIAAFSFFAMLALAIAFGPITSDLALGQLALPAFLAATLVTLLSERRPAAGAIASCFAFAQPNAALGLVSQLGRNRVTLAIVAGAIASFVAGALAWGLAWPAPYARALW